MFRTVRFVVLALAAAVIAIPAASASAAPLSWKSVDVTLQSEQNQSLLLVSGELPSTAKLPYEAELAVPAGTQIQWVGEILGGAASADPELKYVKSTSSGMDLYRFTLTKSRIAQVEGVVQGMGGPVGANYATSLKWTAWQALPEVRISQRIPQTSQILSAAPGATIQPAGTGFNMYTKTVKNLKAGQVLDLTFTYAPPAAGAAAASAGAPASSSGTTALIVIMGIAIAGFGFLVFKVRSKIQPEPLFTKTEPAIQSAETLKNDSSKTTRRKQPVEPEVAPQPAPKRMKPAYLILAVVGILVTGTVIAGSKGVSAKVVGGTMKKSFGAASPCTSASIPVQPNQGVDLSSQGETLLDAFMGQEGIGDVTLDIDRSVVDITFCASSQSEGSVRQILSGTGLVSVAAAPVASAPSTASVDASGKTQTAKVDTASGIFSPAQITLKAGIPAEIAFGQSGGCISEVVFSELGVTQDLTAGPATVKLPALGPGTYKFACAMGHQSGTVVVE